VVENADWCGGKRRLVWWKTLIGVVEHVEADLIMPNDVFKIKSILMDLLEFVLSVSVEAVDEGRDRDDSNDAIERVNPPHGHLFCLYLCRHPPCDSVAPCVCQCRYLPRWRCWYPRREDRHHPKSTSTTPA
jgi:hypothetical protein